MKCARRSTGDVRSAARVARHCGFAATAALLALSIGTGVAGTPEGLAALERSDYASAQRELAPMAEQGDHDAQFALGRMLMHGWGVKRDPQAAVRWFTAAAEGGHERARRMLAALYEQGTDVPRDVAAARKWRCLADRASKAPRQSAPQFSPDRSCDPVAPAELQKIRASAEGGDATAQNLLGTLLAQGTGVDADPRQALRWFREAAKRGDGDAQHNLGAMYELGLGVDVDYRQARAWYGKAPGEDAMRAANRVELLIGWQDLEWGTPLARRPGFASAEPPASLERLMFLQRLLSGRAHYAFHARRADSLQFGGATVKRIVYQSLTQRDGLCAVWIEFEGRGNHRALLQSLASWYGPPHAQTSVNDDRLSMRAWDFHGGVRVLLEHFQWAAADESLGWLAVWHASC